MNIYTTTFFARCPLNSVRIAYRLRIETSLAIPVEAILAEVGSLAEGMHESFSDRLLARFGGVQTLIAEHHGVTIETTRP